jgi:hypothetical protein
MEIDMSEITDLAIAEQLKALNEKLDVLIELFLREAAVDTHTEELPPSQETPSEPPRDYHVPREWQRAITVAPDS